MAPEEEADRGSHALGQQAWALEALASLGDGIMIVDERGVLVYSNPAAVVLTGAVSLPGAPGEWSTRHGIFRADETTPFPAHELPLVRGLRGETTRDVETFVRNASVPQGVHLLVSTTPLRDAEGHPRGAVSYFRDITRRRSDERKLAEGQHQRQAILDSIPDMAWLKDRESRYLAVNRPFMQMAGLATTEEVIGLTDLDIWPLALAEHYRRIDNEVMTTRLPNRLEEPIVNSLGVERWLETVKEVIVDDRGEIVGTMGIARDITERREADAALRVTNDELERRVQLRSKELAEVQEDLVRKERLAVLGQLAGGVAHQIRNPLAAIMNAAYVLKRHLSPEQHPNVEDAIRIIHDEVRHANVIITGLLDYARVRTPDRHPASIVELVERVLAADWIPPTIAIDKTLGEVPLLDVDADQLHGAFFNLVRNAVEAMPDGGTLSVRVSADGDQVVVAVQDTGCGISPQVSAHLFEPLHSTKPMGIGLGLVTARTFIEAHDGRIARVDVPRGACFEIRLPLR